MPKDNEVDEKVRPVAWIVTNGGESCEPWLEYEQSEVDALPAVCIADPLYSAATVAELRAEVEKARIAGIDACDKLTALWQKDIDRAEAAERRVGEVSRLRAALEELICVCDPMQLAEREHERIVEQNERGGTTHYTGAPMLKVRWDDLRDFTAGIKRAQEALNLEPPTDGR